MASSWLEGFTDLVDRLPVPRWVVYGGLWIAWIAFGTGVGLAGGWLQFPSVDLMLAVGAGFPAFVLWAKQALDDVAVRALGTVRPLLDLDDPTVGAVATDLRRTPPDWAAVALVVGGLAGLGSILGSPSSWGLDEHGPAAEWAVGITMSVVASIVVFTFLAHVVHQLRLVDGLHRRHVRVDLFRLQPLYAFATLTARTGVTLLGTAAVGFAVVSQVTPNIRLSAADLSSAVVLVGVSIACFVAPLLSLHDRIVAEKDRRLEEANETLAQTLGELRHRVAAGQLDDAAKLNDAVAAANASVLVVGRISTWPWRPETLRAFAGAVLLPIGLWITFELLRRVLPD